MVVLVVITRSQSYEKMVDPFNTPPSGVAPVAEDKKKKTKQLTPDVILAKSSS